MSAGCRISRRHILSKFSWTLDAASNPTKAQTTRGSTDSYDAYEYDTRNRLTASCYAIAQAATDCNGATNTIGYAYDKVSNRTQETRAGNVGNTGTIDYSYNNADQLTSSTIGGVTTNYSYDANGNQTTAGAKTFTYDLANRLTSATLGGTTTSYGHDGDDRRTSATTPGSADLRYIWDPLAETGLAELALERTPTGTLVRRYTGGPTGALSMSDSSASYYYHHDPLGSVTDVTDASGSGQWRYEYEPYGGTRTITNVSSTAPENRTRFSAQYLDPESDLYHLRARQYDPTSARFLALDPVESPLDDPYTGGYLYASGRPTVLVDPNGEWPRWLSDKYRAVRREITVVGGWAAYLARNASQSARGVVTGESGRRLGNSLYDVYEAAGGGRQGRIAVAHALAGLAVAPSVDCIRAIANGAPSRIASSCGEAALDVFAGAGIVCRAVRGASRAGRTTALLPRTTISKHAAAQMAERGITVRQVEVVIRRGTRVKRSRKVHRFPQSKSAPGGGRV